ncbi:hypothetical protein AGOR_G00121390 [Albula goreensis]|uniref:Ig-like domain-containing protein n=1 Tax=Albula goreensis TaxID=1534307 RepID=A0A8T3DBU9_9TELE|nr:hypothetical protein AGOR_G00121390 [Albula goreensis]
MKTTTYLVFLGFCIACGHSECPIQLNPSTVVVRHGHSAFANCTATEEHYGMGWEASQGGTEGLTTLNSVLWEVENLTDWNTSPMCFVNLKSRQCMKNLNVTIYKYPDSVSLQSPDSRGQMVENTRYRLVCDVQNVAPLRLLTIKLYKGQLEIRNSTYSDNDIKTPESKQLVVPVSPRRGDEGALYRCKAILNLGPDGPQPPAVVQSEPFKITVQYVPEILHQPQIAGILAGADVFFNCTATGNPVPSIEWKHGPAKNVQIQTSGAVSVLRISAVTENQAGNYTCIAKNSLGETREVFTLTVSRGGATKGVVTVGIIAGLLVLVLFVVVGYIIFKRR